MLMSSSSADGDIRFREVFTLSQLDEFMNLLSYLARCGRHVPGQDVTNYNGPGGLPLAVAVGTPESLELTRAHLCQGSPRAFFLLVSTITIMPSDPPQGYTGPAYGYTFYSANDDIRFREVFTPHQLDEFIDLLMFLARCGRHVPGEEITNYEGPGGRPLAVAVGSPQLLDLARARIHRIFRILQFVEAEELATTEEEAPGVFVTLRRTRHCMLTSFHKIHFITIERVPV
ncbi:hypothetical protein EIP91_010075 [Steccherinum ochraceum]|uniref:Uncharacterized protein n=1 Tax=Steccherinum ochraceum TaxID=92696 RepID=A0A4R0R3I6_9APHY|nr:hypothetical protein EIP91_010075 [Steccherinum ochraceum]